MTGEQAAALARILDQTEELASLSEKVNSMQQYLTKDRYLEAACDVAPEVWRVVSGIVDEHPEAVVHTDVESATVPMDGRVFRTLLEELVANAIRHNDRDEPHVTVTADAPTDSEQVRCSVADDGPRIPASERSAVELGPERQLEHSTGIGLSQVHWAVTDHGGDVSIEDNSPRGNVVTIALPRHNPR
jgi:signal transduction histidine kinase